MTCALRCSQSFSNYRFHSLFLQIVRIASRANSRNQACWDPLSTVHDDPIRIFFDSHRRCTRYRQHARQDILQFVFHALVILHCSATVVVQRSIPRKAPTGGTRKGSHLWLTKHGHRFWRCLPCTNHLLADVCFCLCLPLHGIGLAT